MKLYGVSDGKWLHIAEYEITKETPGRYYIKGAMTQFIDKKTMWAYWGESYFTTEQKAAQFLVGLAEERIAKAQEAIERDRIAADKHRAVAQAGEGKG